MNKEKIRENRIFEILTCPFEGQAKLHHLCQLNGLVGRCTLGGNSRGQCAISKILFPLLFYTFTEQNIFFPYTCFAYPILEQKFTVFAEIRGRTTLLGRGKRQSSRRILAFCPPKTGSTCASLTPQSRRARNTKNTFELCVFKGFGDRRGGGGFGGRGGGGGGGGSFDHPGRDLRRPKWDGIQLVPFEKNFYTPAPNLANANPKDVEKFRFEKEITVIKGQQDCPFPITNFEDAGLPDYVSAYKLCDQKSL